MQIDSGLQFCKKLNFFLQWIAQRFKKEDTANQRETFIFRRKIGCLESICRIFLFGKYEFLTPPQETAALRSASENQDNRLLPLLHRKQEEVFPSLSPHSDIG